MLTYGIDLRRRPVTIDGGLHGTTGDFFKLMLVGSFLLVAGGAVGYAVGYREAIQLRTGRRKR